MGILFYQVIRIYDRGIEPPKSQPRLIHVLKGYKNKGWPIKSSYFFGKDCKILNKLYLFLQ